MTVGSHEAPRQPLTDERLLAIAETFEKQGRTAEAERTYRTVLTRNPHAGVAQERLARLSGVVPHSTEPRALPQIELAGQPPLQEPRRLGTPPPAPPVVDAPPVLPLTASTQPKLREQQPAPSKPEPTVTVASREELPATPQIELVQIPPSSGASKMPAEQPAAIVPQDTAGWHSRGSEPKKLPEGRGPATPAQGDFGIVIRPAGN